MTDEQNPESKKKKEMSDGAKKGPEQVIRDGGIAAMIWRRESTTGFPYYEYSISRSWKDQAGKTGYSQYYFSSNEAQLINVIGQATQWIAEAQSRDQAENHGRKLPPAGRQPAAWLAPLKCPASAHSKYFGDIDRSTRRL